MTTADMVAVTAVSSLVEVDLAAVHMAANTMGVMEATPICQT